MDIAKSAVQQGGGRCFIERFKIGPAKSVRHGIPTVTIGSGQYEIHTVKEYVDLPEFAVGCRLAVALATLEG